MVKQKINPYNFVPLGDGPERGGYSGLHRLHEDRYSGVLRCELKVISPLITIDQRDTNSKAYSFLRNDKGQVIIQGTSLKGMIRAVYEALADGCLPFALTSFGGKGQVKTYCYSDLKEHHHSKCNSADKLCEACQLFGTIQGDHTHYQSKVRFTDAVLTSGSTRPSERKVRVLMPPKPHHTQNYGLHGQDDGAIAGRKFYYHHDASPDFTDNIYSDFSKTIAEYADKGTVFSFDVHIQDLPAHEFGQFLWALELHAGLGHKLGLGKAIGMGSCQIIIKDDQSSIYQPQQRYYKWHQSEVSTTWRNVRFDRTNVPAMLSRLPKVLSQR